MVALVSNHTPATCCARRGRSSPSWRGPAGRAAGGDRACSISSPTRRSIPASPTWCAGRTTGTWCARAGPSSRTISPAASPTGSCRPGRRCAKAWSSAPTPVWYILVYGSSALIVLLGSRDLRLAAADAAVVRGYAVHAALLRAAAARPVAAAVRDRAPTSPAASSTATPTSSRSSCSPGRATRMRSCARRSTSTPTPSAAVAHDHAVRHHALAC